jgi:hypothetical protein
MHAASVAAAARIKPKKVDELDFLQCSRGAKGAWALRIDDAIIGPDPDGGDGEVVGYAVVLVHRDDAGAMVAIDLPTETMSVKGRSVEVSVRLAPAWGSRRITTLVAGDVDGDGDPEAFVSGGVFDEGQSEVWSKLFTFHRTSIAEYVPAKSLDLVEFEDADKDGRFDIRTRGAYGSFTQWNAFPAQEHLFSAPLFLAHAQQDGTFSLTDDVARSDLKARCSATQAMKADDEEHDMAMRIVCERASGVAAAAVKRELRAVCKQFADTPTTPSQCWKVLLDVADATPPVTIQ